MFCEPNVQSSYRPNCLGKKLYDLVIKHKPKTIIEFGFLNGCSSICMAQGLKVNGFGEIIAYDLWENYEYSHGSMEEVKENLRNILLKTLSSFSMEIFFLGKKSHLI